MTTTIIYAGTADGDITSTHGTYSTMRTGANLDVSDSASSLRFGQWVSTFGSFNGAQAFFGFAYSALSAEIPVVSAYVRLRLSGIANRGVSRHYNMYRYNWGTSLSTGNWRNISQVSNLPMHSVLRNGHQAILGYFRMGVSPEGLVADYSSTTAIRFMLTSSRLANGNSPSVAEWSEVFSADFAGTALDPALFIVSLPQSFMRNSIGAQAQLSDGSHVFLEFNTSLFTATGNTSYQIKHMDNSGNVTTIRTVTHAESDFGNAYWSAGAQARALCVDSEDNIYLLHPRQNTSQLGFVCYLKGSGYTWSIAAPITWVSLPEYAGRINNIVATWHQMGTGGTILAVVSHSAGRNGGTETAYVLANANILRQGGSGDIVRDSGQAFRVLVNEVPPSDNNNFQNETGTLLDISKNHSNNSVGYVLCARRNHVLGSTGNLSIAKYTIQSGGSGFSSTSTWVHTEDTVKDANAKARIIGISNSQFLTAIADPTGGIVITHWQNVGTSQEFTQLSNVALDGSTPSMPDAGTLATSHNWDVAYDPSGNQVIVYYVDGRSLMKTSVNLDTGLATQSEVEVVEVGSSGSEVLAIRTHRDLTRGDTVLVSVAHVNGSTHSQTAVFDTLNAPPFAPTLVPRSNFNASDATLFEWQFNDPNPGDSQSAFQLQISQGGSVVHDTTKTVSGVESHTLPSSTLTNGQSYQWRVRTWDQEDEQSPWSLFGSFVTSASGTLTIIDPTEDNPEGVITKDYVVQWEVSGSTQTAYRVVVTRTEDSVELVNTGWVTSSDTNYHVDDMLSDMEYEVAVTARNAALVETNTATRLITPLYSQPEEPDITLTTVSAEGYIQVVVVNPEPEGDRPHPIRNDIYRSSGDGFTKVGETEPNGFFRDYTAADGVSYQYLARAVVQ